MSQHDLDIANGSFPTVRADINLALAAIVSNSSGATEPATMFAYQFWADTTTGILKQRNAANTAWISLFKLTNQLFTNSNTAARTYTFQDRNGTIADLADIAAESASATAKDNAILALGIKTSGVGVYTATATLTTADLGRTAYYNSASAGTLTLPAATGNGNKLILVTNISTVVAAMCTIARAGAEQIYANGTTQTSFVLAAGDSIVLFSDGSNWLQLNRSKGSLISSNLHYQVFTSTGTWTKPSHIDGNALVLIECWGAGGGGSSNSTDGGGGGAYASRVVRASSCGATEAVTIGAGGATGNPGANGGATTFGGILQAGGGGGGQSTVGGGGGGGGTSAVTTTAGAAVTAWSVNYKDVVTTENGATGGGTSGSASAGAYAKETGGGSGGRSSAGYGTGSIYGGGGGSSDGATSGGPSVMAGAGGASGANNGVAPGGGGGAAGGAGARGECRVRVLG